MKIPIYLDYAATTPVDPRVAAKMLGYLTSDGHYGNPASLHHYGQTAKCAVDTARAQVAELIHAEPSEIIWTSGATEANNLALKGAAALYQRKGNHIITLKTEHPSVLDCCQELEKKGFSVTYLSPEKNGLITIDQLTATLREETILVSIMHINNELGVIQDIDAIANLTASRGILFHVDAAQSAGKLPLNMQNTPIDLLSLCAHKIYGPKGIGALYLRRKPRVRVAPQIHGGGQEQGMRSGTLPSHQIIGMGEAFSIAQHEMQVDYKKLFELRQQFWQGINSFNTIKTNTDFTHSFPGILNICFSDIPSHLVLNKLPDLAFSTGSACHNSTEPSPVLRAIGLTKTEALSSVRFSLGRFTTPEEINCAVQQIVQAVKMLL